MKEKIKEIVKKDGVYFLVAFGLLIATLLITTTIYHGEDFSLQIPKSTLFGTISWIEILVVGLPSIFLLRNIDRNKTKLEKIYLCLVIPLGILYCLTNPIGRVPDEDMHARKSMAISTGNFFSHSNEEGDAVDTFNEKFEILAYKRTNSYEEALNRIKTEETDTEVELKYTTMALYAPICHMPQAIGMFITRLLGGDLVLQCYMARIFNI